MALLAAGSVAFAQEAGTAADAGRKPQAKQADGAEASAATLDTVTVRDSRVAPKGYAAEAQPSVLRGNVSAKETPHTVETVDVDERKNYGQQDLAAFLEGNAGVDTSYLAWSDIIYMRGFSVTAGDIYRDGVRNGGTFRRTVGNIERIEVLKGPASVLYGRSQGGGVINMVSKKAHFSNAATAGLRAGSWRRYGASLDVNRVLSPQWAVRVNTDIENGHSFRPRINTKGRLFAPSLAFASETGRLKWEAGYTYDYSWYVPDRSPNQSQYDLMGLDYFDVGFARKGDYVKARTDLATSKLSYQLNPDWTLDWSLGYLKNHQDFDHFYLGTFNPRTRLLSPNYSWVLRDQRTSSNSLLLKGKAYTGAFEHQLMLGYDFSYEKASDASGARLGTATWAINPYADPATWPANTHRLVPGITTLFNARSHSLFMQDVISLTPTVKLSFGGRYDWYSYKFNTVKHDGGDFSPNIGVVWAVHPAHNLYASYSRSFAPLGGNGNLSLTRGLRAEQLTNEPQYNVQYEAGIKSDWLDGRLSTTASVYRITHNNIRYQPDAQNDPYNWAVAGKERSQGVDISITGSLTPQWHLRGSLGAMSAKVIEDVSNPARQGHYLRSISKRQASLFVRYAPDNVWYGELGMVYNSRRAPNPPAAYDTGLAGYTRFDAAVGYRLGRHLSGTLAIHNLGNKVYWRSEHMPGSPRSFFLRLNYDF